MKIEELITAADFYEFFEKIPDEKWTTNNYEDEGKCCARGHLGDRTAGHGQGSASEVLRDLLIRNLGIGPVDINDGRRPAYQQPTPKARILAALKDVMAKEEIQ